MIVIIISLAAVFLIKNNRTSKVRLAIIDAIHDYNVHCIKNGLSDRISFNCLPDYEKTLFNFFNWGYKGIVPDDVFEKIQPFLKGDKHE